MDLMKILITGANGFVGSNVTNYLQKSFSINCLVRDIEYINNSATVFYFKHYQDSSIEDSIKNVDAVVHIASMIHGNKEKMTSFNVDFTNRLLSLCSKYKINHFIYISTENTEHNLKDIYTITKKKAEELTRKYFHHTILKPTIIYGKGDKKYLGKLIGIIRKYPIIPVLGDGSNRFQFVNIVDLCTIIQKSIENKIYGTYGNN